MFFRYCNSKKEKKTRMFKIEKKIQQSYCKDIGEQLICRNIVIMNNRLLQIMGAPISFSSILFTVWPVIKVSWADWLAWKYKLLRT